MSNCTSFNMKLPKMRHHRCMPIYIYIYIYKIFLNFVFLEKNKNKKERKKNYRKYIISCKRKEERKIDSVFQFDQIIQILFQCGEVYSSTTHIAIWILETMFLSVNLTFVPFSNSKALERISISWNEMGKELKL